MNNQLLSPAAQAVFDAVWREIDYIPESHVRWAAISALRAAVDQVCASDAVEPRNYLPMAIENDRIRREFLAIAAELEAHQ